MIDSGKIHQWKLKSLAERLFEPFFNCCFCCLVAKSCLTLLWPHGLSPTRLLCPWNSPGKNTGVGYHSLLQGGSSRPRDRTVVSHVAGGFFTVWATGKVLGFLGSHEWSLTSASFLNCKLSHSGFTSGNRAGGRIRQGRGMKSTNY